MDQGGAEAFSLREAARAIGVSPAAAYRHFADKAGLLAAVVDADFAELADDLGAASDAITRDQGHEREVQAAATVLAFGRVYVRRAGMHPERFHLASATVRTAPGPGEQRVRHLAEDMRAQLVETGAIHPHMFQNASWTIVPALYGLASLAADGQLDDAHRDDGVQAVVQTMLRGLGVSEETLAQMGSLLHND